MSKVCNPLNQQMIGGQVDLHVKQKSQNLQGKLRIACSLMFLYPLRMDHKSQEDEVIDPLECDFL